MILGVIRELAKGYSKVQLENAAKLFEREKNNYLAVSGKDEGEILSHLLMAILIREKLDGGMPLNEALKEHGRMIQGIVTAPKATAKDQKFSLDLKFPPGPKPA